MRALTPSFTEQQLILAGRSQEAIRAVTARTGARFPRARAAVLTWEAERLAALQLAGQPIDPRQ